MTQLPIGILISGRGSNMQAVLAAMAADPGYPAHAAVVIANRPDAAGLITAQTAGVATEVIDHTAFADRAAFEAALDARLRAHGVQLVVLAGFMRVLTPWFVGRWARRLINIHPSLLPKHKGLDTHARALAAGDREHGCTVHYVSDGVDEGEIIAQARVPILPDDTEQTLAARVLAAEHALYPKCIAEICQAALNCS